LPYFAAAFYINFFLMKQLHTILLFAAVLLSASGFAQTIFVNSTASGANNGSSWANAYTKLNAALAAAQAGSNIWVAAGTYRPDSTSLPDKAFLVESGVNLYGGFNGTEATFNERDFLTNVTILSGDLRGDDVTGNFTLKRSDNSLHILRIENGDPDNRTIVDGFQLRSGNTLDGATSAANDTRGAAILATAKVTVRNCIFVDNFARAGVVTANGPLASGILVDNCIFDANRSSTSSAGVLMLSVEGGEVNKSIFRNNNTNRGCVYFDRSSSIVTDSCLFEKNKAIPTAFGSAMFIWQSDYQVTNCIFRENTTVNALCYIDGREGNNVGSFTNCLIENNTATGFGAGLYNWQANMTVRNCTFTGNSGPGGSGFYANSSMNNSDFLVDNCLFKNNKTTGTGSGGAMYNRSAIGTVKNCTFETNNGTYGGAIANYSPGTLMKYDSCLFKSNKAAQGGGAMHTGFTASISVNHCTFQENTARVGAALGLQNDTTSLLVENSYFAANNAEIIGGAIAGYTAGVNINIRNTTFDSNSADTGGAIHISEDSLDMSVLTVNNTIFAENLAFTQAAGVNVLKANANFTNCLFHGNLNLGAGAGGAISNNAAQGHDAVINALNCTFVNNESSLGAGIAQFQDDSSDAVLVLQNNIFYNLTGDYAVEGGTPTVTSKGGNLSNDLTFSGLLTALNDLLVGDPVFVDENNKNFRLQAGSPAIDKGIAAGAPAKDLDGKPRDSKPDMGSYEYGTSAVGEPLPVPIRLTPNPTTDWVQATLDNDQNAPVLVDIVALGGQVVSSVLIAPSDNNRTVRLSVENLPAGAYFMKMRVGTTRYVGGFVKQ